MERRESFQKNVATFLFCFGTIAFNLNRPLGRLKASLYCTPVNYQHDQNGPRQQRFQLSTSLPGSKPDVKFACVKGGMTGGREAARESSDGSGATLSGNDRGGRLIFGSCGMGTMPDRKKQLSICKRYNYELLRYPIAVSTRRHLALDLWVRLEMAIGILEKPNYTPDVSIFS